MNIAARFPLLLALALAALPATAAPEILPREEAPLARFGFAGPEIFPVDFQISQLHAADLDGDGLQDLIVVNNARSKINLLYNRTGKTGAADRVRPVTKRELNELPPGSRFRIDSVASEKRIAALLVADFNHDGRPDLAYYGEPKELVLQYNEGTNGWSLPRRWPIDDGQLTPNAMYAGDLNGDGRRDLLLCGETHIYFFMQTEAGTFAEPEKIPFVGNVKAVQVLDIDGDGRDDLLLVNWDDPHPFRVRFQTAAGNFGPEMHFAMPSIRAYWADDLDADRKTEVITIAQNSGRAQIFNFIQKPAEPLLGALQKGQFQILPLNRTDKARRGMVWADLNGDKRDDLLVSEPASAQLTVYFQQPDGTLGAPRAFPTLSGVSELAVADWDGDGKPEIFLLSADERQVGVTQLDKNGRIPFPTILPLEGRPLTMTVGPLKPKARPTLCVIVDQEGRRSLWMGTAKDQPRVQKLSESFRSNPASILIHDANQDGHPDLVVLVPYEKIKFLVQAPGKDFEEVDLAPPGGSADQPWATAADVDGDGKAELLVGQRNFIRAIVLQSETRGERADPRPVWSLVVREQINGAASNSRIIAAAALPNGTNPLPSLFLLDAERKSLTLCERDAAGVWQAARNVLLPVSDFHGLTAVAINSKRPNAIAFLGLNHVAWMNFAGKVWDLTELDSYETPIKDGRLHDVVSGDLDNDGRKDLVFLETARNHIDIVTFEKPHRLVPADRWQVFEERTFRGRRGDAFEPREALIVDLTGNGQNDLAIIVHDRILVYPQE